MSFEKYYIQDWWVSKIPRHKAQLFSYKYVIQPAASYRRIFVFHTSATIIRHLHRAYRYWFNRCKELVCRDLWLPTPPDNSTAVIHRAVRYCLYCVPTHVLLHKDRKLVKVFPCNQYHICPFCASRAAEDIYRRFIRARALFRTTTDATVTCRIETYFVKAQGFNRMGWSSAAAIRNTQDLADILKNENLNYQKIAKDLRVHTLGSLWSVFAIPADNGWRIQVRQFYITAGKSKRPSPRRRRGSELFIQSAKLREYENTIKLLGAFVAYPPELLTDYAELTAVALNARRCIRLFNGTGQLYNVGRIRTEKSETSPLGDVP